MHTSWRRNDDQTRGDITGKMGWRRGHHPGCLGRWRPCCCLARELPNTSAYFSRISECKPTNPADIHRYSENYWDIPIGFIIRSYPLTSHPLIIGSFRQKCWWFNHGDLAMGLGHGSWCGICWTSSSQRMWFWSDLTNKNGWWTIR